MSVPESSAAERSYRVILDGILGGAYTPGTMLGEASLAASIGVSRTPVRAALARLQDEGWITIYSKRGALVQGLSDRAVTDLIEARLILESTSAGLATPEARDLLADQLTVSIAAQKEAFRDSDVRRFIESTISFHRSFVEASGNAVLLELNDRLTDRQRFLLFRHGDRLLARCAGIVAEHEELATYLGKGDATRFAATLRGHLTENYGAQPRPLP